MQKFALFYFADGTVKGDYTSIIENERDVRVIVASHEDVKSDEAWIEVVWPPKRRGQERVAEAAKVLFLAGTWDGNRFVLV